MIVESQLELNEALYRDVVPAGDYYMKVVKKGQTVRILDIEGNQAADTLFYNANDPSERYSAIDTIREQGNVYLTAGTKILSDQGNVMLEIVAVGAMAMTLELRIPFCAIFSRIGVQSSLPPFGTSTVTPRSCSSKATVSCGRSPRSHLLPS